MIRRTKVVNTVILLAVSNIAGRDRAGVHYRSDGVEGIKLGEAIAISILEDAATLYSEAPGFSFTKCDSGDNLSSVLSGATRSRNLGRKDSISEVMYEIP